MSHPTPPAPLVRPALARGTGLFCLWLVLAAPLDPSAPAALAPDLLVGLLATIWATWVSLRLLPPAPGHLRWFAVARLGMHLLWHSVVGGVDVALRAFHPRLPLRFGFIAYTVGLPAGPRRAAFSALSSLMPGTLPVGTDRDGALVYHCLDMDQPVAASLGHAEALFVRTRVPPAGEDRD